MIIGNILRGKGYHFCGPFKDGNFLKIHGRAKYVNYAQRLNQEQGPKTKTISDPIPKVEPAFLVLRL